ncbi:MULTISPECIES: bifunctional 2-polyprenyl-6-hydroxyphenol methylase/3-demethylubiquinol 3-O-methyltransferase UbiG [unclassified Gilliamella]|uniref:bifunctional 2-polyprenyl-6-hydroxyphenol methylase/3-demethylubiquinol 3-O-methyltransferase UbiG n=1 Tax=unclassified Gilliamella TaxID=2685620 RepID=UPI002269BBD7|nr:MULTISPECIES: bifunctional 2-polyprenyl-6-hydroxyphenol methylase/3-demethylubiquinol 3-O-methyltransferase UbiG [unclassified Gilliamella]MCX8642389.1 bifunctional 2-polyprenyl-6-hydroxyphenol methylase/3-demethylubiquinol 3-O-methyltransferase UbiG [Gilliamella sp. B3835]MCX8707787.1 bifunctional 2-polyprenyl-6-hydroxyphenol methylase/3-demethylubiquinol 3-O-methyltransferase UbiG [Gilliamella sp. B3783]MCX8709360.1 bifunctional 2-polyprenyl-6-hydroxyphenol methylase/3-demethylubiquinol 3-O
MSQNIDINEINKFSQMAAQWWDPNGKCKPLHIINPLRVDYVKQKCGSLEQKNVLDVGCGGGILSESLAKLGANVTAIDLADESLQVAKCHAQQSGLSITYLKQTVEEHADQKSDYYDMITCMELLEHVPDPFSIINACAKLLKPGGKLFLSTINRNYKAKLMLIYGAEYIARLVPKGTHDANKFIRPSELMLWVEQSGLVVKDIIGMEYHLLKNQFTLGSNVDVNYIMMAQKEINNDYE